MIVMGLVWLAFAFAVLFNILMFIPAFIYKTDKLTDLSYSLTFIALAFFGYIKSSAEPVHTLLFFMVVLWAIRLGTFLFIRIRKQDRDRRFDGMREDFIKFLRFWLLQGVSVAVILLSVLLNFANSQPVYKSLSLLGVLCFGFGLTLESVADLQKYRFSQRSENRNKWIDQGVWRASRHPNYLGEMLVWLGVYAVAYPSLSIPQRFVAFLSPLYIILLLMFVSGVPLLEKSADERWGNLKGYQDYKKSVPVLIPSIKSILRLFAK